MGRVAGFALGRGLVLELALLGMQFLVVVDDLRLHELLFDVVDLEVLHKLILLFIFGQIFREIVQTRVLLLESARVVMLAAILAGIRLVACLRIQAALISSNLLNYLVQVFAALTWGAEEREQGRLLAGLFPLAQAMEKKR